VALRREFPLWRKAEGFGRTPPMLTISVLSRRVMKATLQRQSLGLYVHAINGRKIANLENPMTFFVSPDRLCRLRHRSERLAHICQHKQTTDFKIG